MPALDAVNTIGPYPAACMCRYAGWVTKKRAGEVGVEDRTDVVDREVFERGVSELARVVDHDLDGAEHVEGGLRDRGATFGVATESLGHGRSTELDDLPGDGFGAVRHHVVAHHRGRASASANAYDRPSP